MNYELDQGLFSPAHIARRVVELSQDIARDYTGKRLHVVCILKGAVFFFTDLVRLLPLSLTSDFIEVQSYEEGTESGQLVLTHACKPERITDADVLVVEDILDTGKTLAFLLEQLRSYNPASLAVAVLLNKVGRRQVILDGSIIRYVGFEIPDVFVVGYGLDVLQKFRNLPGIWTVKTVPEEVSVREPDYELVMQSSSA
jgi:hypoxanthine phosphoribosyltransferase